MCARLNKSFLRAAFLFLGASLLSIHAQTPAPATASLRVVNATSVPAISLSVNDANDYPDFPQGQMTGAFPIEASAVKYAAVNLANGAKAESDTIRYATDSQQTLIIVGDFSTDCPPGELPSSQPSASPEKPYEPNVLFKVFQHGVAPQGKTIRVQVYNAMPRTALEFSGKTAERQALVPGQVVTLMGQPRPAFYQAVAGGETLNLTLSQTDVENQIVVFFLKSGKPAYEIISEPRFAY